MTGNVWEWCWDWYDEEYYAISDSINPKGPSTGTRRVARGGSYKSGKLYIRSSNRTTDEEDIESCGLRIVRNK
jgi:formylglycine-generating enzyme required for sulfatase activity